MKLTDEQIEVRVNAILERANEASSKLWTLYYEQLDKLGLPRAEIVRRLSSALEDI